MTDTEPDGPLDGDSVETGSHDGDSRPDGQTERPSGTSDADDQTGIDPQEEQQDGAPHLPSA